MYDEERTQIEEILTKYADLIRVNIGNLYVFGAGDYGRGIVRVLRKQHINVTKIIDNDEKKIGSYFEGCRILNAKELTEHEINKGCFMICSRYWKEMFLQLQSQGVKKQRIIIFRLRTFSEGCLINIADAIRGRHIYRIIKKRFPQHMLFLCPYTGTGDIYLIGTLLKQYIAKEKIDNYAMIVVSCPCHKVASMFGIDNIYQIGGSLSCRQLVKFYMIAPDKCNLKILNDAWLDVVDPMQWMRGLHDMNFMTMFRRFVFELPETSKPEHPKFVGCAEELKTLQNRFGLEPEKTVIIAPYATTLSELSLEFWEDIAGILKERGYIVCTNTSGDDELPISNTKKVFFALDIAPQFIEWCGTFIGVRSGLCDVISGTRAKKIILYDKDNYFFNMSSYRYFSLNENGLSDDAIEIEFDSHDLITLKEKILKEMERIRE